MPVRLSVVLLVLCVVGCGSTPPPATPVTWPVTGHILRKDGQCLKAGVVCFRLRSDISQAALSKINEDGSFTLKTQLVDGRNLPGAVAGEFEVMILPPAEAPQGETPFSLRRTYQVEARDNVLEIHLEG